MPRSADRGELVSSGGITRASDWWIGFFLAIPLAYPTQPYYEIAFLVFGFASFQRGLRGPYARPGKFVPVLALIVLGLLSSFVGMSHYELDAMRVLTTSFFFIFFLFGGLIDDKRALLDGFSRSSAVMALVVIGLATILRIDQYGLLLFSVPDFRLWGYEYLPDWPNFLAFLISLGFVLNALVFRRPLVATVQLIAALLTTSRTPMIALGLVVGVWTIERARRGVGGVVSLGAAAGIFVMATLALNFEANTSFTERLLVFDDRDEIYSFALNLVARSPLIGHGAVLLDSSIGFEGQPTFHNTYLDIAVRHGLVALIVFLYLLLPRRASVRIGGPRFVAALLFFVVGSLFQNFLKHPHIILLYVVLLEASATFPHHRAIRRLGARLGQASQREPGPHQRDVVGSLPDCGTPA